MGHPSESVYGWRMFACSSRCILGVIHVQVVDEDMTMDKNAYTKYIKWWEKAKYKHKGNNT